MIAKKFVNLRNISNSQKTTLHEWAHIYADPDTKLLLTILYCHNNDLKIEHDNRQVMLKSHINRIINKTPLITATYLKNNLNIPYGSQLGHLLKKAEIIAINQNINDPQQLLKLLSINS